MRLEADDGRPETSPPLRRGVQTADRAVVRERQAIPEDPPSWPDILRTIELGYSNARLEASDNRIKVTIRMAYGFHHANNPIASSCSAAADSTYAHHNQEPNPRKQQKPHMYWTFLRREGGVTAALRCENARLRSWALTVEPAIMAQATIATRRY